MMRRIRANKACLHSVTSVLFGEGLCFSFNDLNGIRMKEETTNKKRWIFSNLLKITPLVMMHINIARSSKASCSVSMNDINSRLQEIDSK